jgi:glycyl-tRNA synthetase beta subunit
VGANKFQSKRKPKKAERIALRQFHADTTNTAFNHGYEMAYNRLITFAHDVNTYFQYKAVYGDCGRIRQMEQALADQIRGFLNEDAHTSNL